MKQETCENNEIVRVILQLQSLNKDNIALMERCTILIFNIEKLNCINIFLGVKVIIQLFKLIR
jgi:hypothetical protein